MPFFQKHFQLILIIIVIAVAIFFRFWQIRDYVVFLGDEGRDMIVMRDIFINKRLPFLGPTASVGGFYLGPIYYWMAAPFLLLWGFDPVGPAYFVAIVGVATVFLLYRFLKETVGFWPAILVSLLYSTAPLIVRYSRSSWNPNPLPFFALLMIYFIYLGIKKKKWIFYAGAGASFGVAIQLHYLAIMLIIISSLIVLVNTNYKKWPQILASASTGFIITFSPFLFFEIRHSFPNFKTILEFVTRGSTTGFQTSNFIWLLSNFGNILLEEISIIKGTVITRIFFWFLTLGGLSGLFFYRKTNNLRISYSIGIIWFLGGLLTLKYYSGQIFDYYFGFMFPAPFFLIGLIFSTMWKNNIFRIFALIIMILTFAFFISKGFYRNSPNRLINQTVTVADFVIQKTNQESFNFALISNSNSDHAYRYFLETKDHKPLELDELVTNQLLVVCESKKCEPLGHPIWEIAGFGRAEIDGEWELPDIGIRVYRLTHWPGELSPAGKPAIKGS